MKKRQIRIISALIIFLCLFFSISVSAVAADEVNGETVVVFTADVHHNSTENKTAAKRLENFLNFVTTEYGKIDALGICGDLGNASVYYSSTYWQYAKRVMDTVTGLKIEGYYTTGNHEYENGKYSENISNETAKKYIRLGLAKSTDNYEIYCFGAAAQATAFTESDIQELSVYLKSVGSEKPVFILSHYPLHALTYTEDNQQKTRDPAYRNEIIDLLNQYPNTFFIWGHNHSKNDPNYDKIQTESIGDKKINFTYAAAGAMTEPEENRYSGNITGKMLVALISQDGTTVSLRYLDMSYQAFAEWTNDTILKVKVTSGSTAEGSTMQITADISEPTPVYFALACFDAKGKMLGTTITQETIGSEDNVVKLTYPFGIIKSDIARLQVMAIDADSYCPLGPATTRYAFSLSNHN